MKRALCFEFIRGLAAPMALYSDREVLKLAYPHQSFADAIRSDQMRMQGDVRKVIQTIQEDVANTQTTRGDVANTQTTRGDASPAPKQPGEMRPILVRETITKQSWHGPLPPPAVLERYETMIPGAAEMLHADD